jgi:hypothetical protein
VNEKNAVITDLHHTGLMKNGERKRQRGTKWLISRLNNMMDM